MKRVILSSSNPVLLSSEYFDLVEISGEGVNDTPWIGQEVISKGKAEDLVIDIRIQDEFIPSKEYSGYRSEPIKHTPERVYVSFGLKGSNYSDEEILEVSNILQEAVKFAREVRKYYNLPQE